MIPIIGILFKYCLSTFRSHVSKLRISWLGEFSIVNKYNLTNFYLKYVQSLEIFTRYLTIKENANVYEEDFRLLNIIKQLNVEQRPSTKIM